MTWLLPVCYGLISVPLPGTSARLEIPSLDTLSELAAETQLEVAAVGAPAILSRTLSAQQALWSVDWEFVRGRAQAARQARKLFERLGATYVKLGQLIASSPTVFPAEVCDEFENCLDRAPPVSYESIARVFEESTGQTVDQAFQTFDRTPLATASVAQVHAATLRDGSRVVVKIRKPGVDATLRCDLAFVAVVAKFSEAFAPELKRVNLAGLADDLRQSIVGELDFTVEATRLEEFRAFLTRTRLTSVARVPEPVPHLTTMSVLTMTRLFGEPLVDSRATEDAVAAMIRVWALSVVEGPFFHADLHGGNVLLLDDGRIGFLDFGIVGSLPRATYDAVLQMADAYNRQDARGIANALATLGVATSTLNLDTLASDLDRLVFAAQSPPTARLVTDVIDVAERNALELPREFGLLVKQALYLDRYISALAPDLDVLADPRVALLPKT